MYTFVRCCKIRDSWAVAGLNRVISSRLQRFVSLSDLLLDVCSKEEDNNRLVLGKPGVRNCDGQFVLVHISSKKSVLTVIEGEGVALFEAIKLAIL
ncbi:hypothetical protein A2U01_0035311, partial [Trifolium medium]|nr:hypothetical protein [Trifolium medium]